MTPRLYMDSRKPHVDLDKGDEAGPNFILQDGIVFAWSDSNLTYEFAWWLLAQADGTTEIVKHLRATRCPDIEYAAAAIWRAENPQKSVFATTPVEKESY